MSLIGEIVSVLSAIKSVYAVIAQHGLNKESSKVLVENIKLLEPLLQFIDSLAPAAQASHKPTLDALRVVLQNCLDTLQQVKDRKGVVAAVKRFIRVDSFKNLLVEYNRQIDSYVLHLTAFMGAHNLAIQQQKQTTSTTTTVVTTTTTTTKHPLPQVQAPVLPPRASKPKQAQQAQQAQLIQACVSCHQPYNHTTLLKCPQCHTTNPPVLSPHPQDDPLIPIFHDEKMMSDAEDKDIADIRQLLRQQSLQITNTLDEQARINHAIAVVEGRATMAETDRSLDAHQWWSIPRSAVTEHGRVIGQGPFGRILECQYHEAACVKKELIQELNSLTIFNAVNLVRHLQHPTIPRLRGVNITQAPYFILMEYCSRGTLHHVLKTAATQPTPAVTATLATLPDTLTRQRRFTILRDVAVALDYLHTRVPPIIHQSLNSHSILVRQDWTACVSDVGLKCEGAHQWMGPELLEDEKSGSTPASDIYAFGLVMWEMATGQQPWDGMDSTEIKAAVTHGARPDSLTKLPYDEWYVQLMHECWASNAAERPSAADVGKVLEAHIPQHASIPSVVSAPFSNLPLSALSSIESNTHSPSVAAAAAVAAAAVSPSSSTLSLPSKSPSETSLFSSPSSSSWPLSPSSSSSNPSPSPSASVSGSPDSLGSAVLVSADGVESWYLSGPYGSRSDDRTETEVKGGSGFGRVFECRYAGIKCCMKLLPATLDSATMQQLSREMSIVKAVQHPNITQLYGFNLTNQPYFLLMESCQESLNRILSTPSLVSRLDPIHRISILRDVAVALSFLHTHSPVIIHRDLNSHNILIREGNSACISDFGLAKVKQDESIISHTVGNYAWMAPEIMDAEAVKEAEAKKPYTTAVDMFAFGVIMWEMATETQPWLNHTPIQIYNQVYIHNERLDSISPVNAYYADIPMYVELMQQCWHRDPRQRPKAAYAAHQLELIRQTQLR